MADELATQKRTPPLVPELSDISRGYELPLEQRHVRGTPVRLFTVAGGCEDPARTVVCLPGLGASGRSFAPLSPLGQDWRLLLWTPPLETPSQYTPLAWNVASLMDAEAGLPERFTLLGSSFGSLVSLVFALEHPERVKALVLVSPVATVRRIRRFMLALSTLVRAPMPFTYLFAPAVARVLGGAELPAEGRAEIVREARRLSPLEMLRRLQDVLGADYLGALERVRCPTLVVHGARDPLVPLAAARAVARRIPHAELAVLPRASHLPYMSHPEDFNARLRSFLEAHARP